MHSLVAITPLGSTAPRVDVIGDVTITEIADRALASLSSRLGHEADIRAKGQQLIGADLPDVGRSVSGTEMTAFWIGPDSWMLDADYDAHTNLAAEVKAVVESAGSVVEQTDAWCRFDVSGSGALASFERLSNVDIHAMQTGDATRTSIHHIGCYILCQNEGTAFSVLGPRSSAASLHHALVETAESIKPTA